MPTDPSDPRPTSEVVASLVVNVQALVAKELELLRLDLRRLVTEKASALVVGTAGLLAGLLTLAFLGITVARGLESLLPSPWMAWAIVTLGVGLTAAALTAAAVARLARSWLPTTFVRSVTDTVAWARSEASDLVGHAAAGPTEGHTPEDAADPPRRWSRPPADAGPDGTAAR